MLRYTEEFGTVEEAYKRYCELWSCGKCMIGQMAEAAEMGCEEFIRTHRLDAKEWLLNTEGWECPEYPVLTEAVETCPQCEGENVFPNWDVSKQGYEAICQHCGEKIMLCDECLHADDNPGRKCDWSCDWTKGETEGHCWRKEGGGMQKLMVAVSCSNCGSQKEIVFSAGNVNKLIDEGWNSYGGALYCPECSSTWDKRNKGRSLTGRKNTLVCLDNLWFRQQEQREVGYEP